MGDVDEPGPAHHLSFHTSEGINGSLLYRYLLKRGEESVWGSYSLFQIEYIDRRKVPGGAQALTYSTVKGDWRFDAQLAAGLDAVFPAVRASLRVGKGVLSRTGLPLAK